jgi:hypothetical protein
MPGYLWGFAPRVIRKRWEIALLTQWIALLFSELLIFKAFAPIYRISLSTRGCISSFQIGNHGLYFTYARARYRTSSQTRNSG